MTEPQEETIVDPRRLRRMAIASLACILLAACGDSDDDDAATTTSDPSGAVADVRDVRNATIQIVAQGSFAEPAGSLAAYEQLEGAGSGSGFIIDPSGIAVTNNHVVTGAATLEVYVGGADEPINARVLGVSECADLAVIDLEGDDYPFLDWYDGEIQPGLEVRAAGFPLGDPEYTLTSGIVSKASADGESTWASVDRAIEHDANIQPGNSGGPLVDAETGRVVAVNYAGGDPGTGTSQFFAIGADLARDVVEQLRGGVDVESLGVNGQAVFDDVTGVQGIWVSSVDTDSPAGDLGLRPGDVIEKIEGLSVGTDGTMETYCDILQSNAPGEQLAVQVLRFEEDARLRGEFNGDELAPYESLGLQVQQETGGFEETGEEDYGDYELVSDDAGVISVSVPTSWLQRDGAAFETETGPVNRIIAAPDLAAFAGSWSAPGVTIVASQESGLVLDELLDSFVGEAGAVCEDGGREDYDDGLYTGRVQYYTACDGTDGITVGIVAEPADGSFVSLLIVQMASEADLSALDEIIATFTISF